MIHGKLLRAGERSLLAVLALGCAFTAGPQAQEEDARARLEELRERWEAKAPEERALLRRRFEEWRALDLERRDEIVERARRWKQQEAAARAAADEDLRRELEELAPPERERRWRERTLEVSREDGRRLLERLPPHVRRRLEEAPPEKRGEVLKFLLGRHDERGRRVLHLIGRRLDLPPERVRELESLPPEERLRAVLELRRAWAEREGRPLDPLGVPDGPRR